MINLFHKFVNLLLLNYNQIWVLLFKIMNTKNDKNQTLKIEALSEVYNTTKLPFVVYNKAGDIICSFPSEHKDLYIDNPLIQLNLILEPRGVTLYQSGEFTFFAACFLDAETMLVTAPVSTLQTPNYSPFLAQVAVKEDKVTIFYDMIQRAPSFMDDQLISFVSTINYIWSRRLCEGVSVYCLTPPDSEMVTSDSGVMNTIMEDTKAVANSKRSILRHIDSSYFEDIYKAIANGDKTALEAAIKKPHQGKAGFLSHDNTQQIKYECVIKLHNASKACIEAGMDYDLTKDLVEAYIRSIDTMEDINEIKKTEYYAYMDLCNRVKNSGKTQGFSSCTIKAIQFMEQNVFAPITVEDIIAKVNYDGNFEDLFKEETHKNIKEYLVEERLKKSLLMLTGTDMTLKDISRLLNFETQEEFTQNFSNIYGMTPGKYRVRMT